jgi:DNA-binding transcriptional regulator YiaG
MASRKGSTQRRAPKSPGSNVGKLDDPEVQVRLRKALDLWEKRTASLVEAVRSSERLSKDDFAIRINTRG